MTGWRVPEIVLGFLLAIALWALFAILSLPDVVAAWLLKWQTLASATVAVIAAYIAFNNTSRSLRQAQELETHRRSRKHAALRAVLSHALAQVIDYAERSANALDDLVHACVGETLPPITAPQSLVQPLPSETLRTMADFIEYSDTVDVGVVEATVAWIEIHDARLRALVETNRDPLRIVQRTAIMGGIIDAASIYAGAATIFQYARRQQEQLPGTVLWQAVREALIVMHLWNDELEALITQRERRTAGPFERLRE